MVDADIRELRLLADLEAISEKYAERYGAAPINLSLWNPAKSLIQDMELRLPPSPDLRGIDYAFSYELPERATLLQALGFDPTTRGCLLTHSGSTAIVAAANWLKARGCSRVLIVGPRYFTVPYALASLGIDWTVAYMHRSKEGKFSFPAIEDRLLGGIDALWLTSPVYCTGVDYDDTESDNFISTILRRGKRIVIDECLSESGRRVGPKFANQGVAAIYAPHKSVCVNGIKFAVVVFDGSEQDHFDSWCDVWNGCLPISSIVGIRHFLSPDFVRYQTQFRQLTAHSHERVRAIVRRTSSILLDPGAEGYLISIYAPQIEAKAGLDTSFLEDAVNATGAIFIAGARNEMDPEVGLSFRLNLAAIDTAALGAFARLCAWLDRPSINQ
jgi:aspartate/methionine/tyrosine aminotransferase